MLLPAAVDDYVSSATRMNSPGSHLSALVPRQKSSQRSVPWKAGFRNQNHA